jgi:hypothetical protein
MDRLDSLYKERCGKQIEHLIQYFRLIGTREGGGPNGFSLVPARSLDHSGSAVCTRRLFSRSVVFRNSLRSERIFKRPKPIEEIRPGDVVWFSPSEKHWHGAKPTTAMTHIAIQEKKDGKVVDWMEHVSDEQYRTKT